MCMDVLDHRKKFLSTLPNSTISPAYITATLSVILATTPKSGDKDNGKLVFFFEGISTNL